MRIGIVGGGQLGRMLVLAGRPLGLDFVCVDPKPDAPAAAVAPLVAGGWEDEVVLRALAACDVVTWEVEAVPADLLRRVAERTVVRPPPAVLAVSQDRLAEKRLFRELDLPTPRFRAVGSRSGLSAAVRDVGLPAVLKTRFGGYDGRGQARIRCPADVEPAWRAVGGRPSILEAHVPFDRELSVLGVRTRSGDVRFWPLVENEHRDGILRVSRAPAPASTEMEREAVRHLGRLLHHLDYVGVATLELFACGERLLANELAARVHNSGHWTWEGAATSQFENHLRAVVDLPLGEVEARGPCAMVNAIGALPPAEPVLAVPGASLHRYGKAPAPGRKLGHVTVLAPSPGSLEARLGRILALAGEPPGGRGAP